MFGHPGNLSACVDALGHLGLYVRPFTRNLGVIFDSTFKFEKQISSVVKASFFQLRLLAKVKPYLPLLISTCISLAEEEALVTEGVRPHQHTDAWVYIFIRGVYIINISMDIKIFHFYGA